MVRGHDWYKLVDAPVLTLDVTDATDVLPFPADHQVESVWGVGSGPA